MPERRSPVTECSWNSTLPWPLLTPVVEPYLTGLLYRCPSLRLRRQSGIQRHGRAVLVERRERPVRVDGAPRQCLAGHEGARIPHPSLFAASCGGVTNLLHPFPECLHDGGDHSERSITRE